MSYLQLIMLTGTRHQNPIRVRVSVPVRPPPWAFPCSLVPPLSLTNPIHGAECRAVVVVAVAQRPLSTTQLVARLRPRPRRRARSTPCHWKRFRASPWRIHCARKPDALQSDDERIEGAATPGMRVCHTRVRRCSETPARFARTKQPDVPGNTRRVRPRRTETGGMRGAA